MVCHLQNLLKKMEKIYNTVNLNISNVDFCRTEELNIKESGELEEELVIEENKPLKNDSLTQEEKSNINDKKPSITDYISAKNYVSVLFN